MTDSATMPADWGAKSFDHRLGMAFFLLCVAVASAWGNESEPNVAGRSNAESSAVASWTPQNDYARWQETLELARRKDPSTKALLIERLRDDYQPVRGSAAWGLSQIGGKDAQDALLEYLRASLKGKNEADLARATEAERELPDKRAVDLLINCLQIEVDGGLNPYIKSYAAEALGKIGDPKSSVYLAQQLNLDIDYGMSFDYWFLNAIRKTKGAGATPLLVEYLDRLVRKMAGQDLGQYQTNIGHEYRQVEHNFRMYELTLSALEAVTGRKSLAGPREDVARDWKEWWQERSAREDAKASAVRPQR